ncbi:MAG TPA: hypothetical protein VGM13_13825 [Thermoanaerobaculia bacterium]
MAVIIAVSLYTTQQSELNPVFAVVLMPGFLLSLAMHGGILHDIERNEPQYLNIAVAFVVLGTAAIYCFRYRE